MSEGIVLFWVVLGGVLLWIGVRQDHAAGTARPPPRPKRDRWKLVVPETKPLLLEKSKLLLVEQRLELWDPVHMRSRADEVYQQPNGELVVVDTKSRERPVIYRKDVIGLSLYGYILRQMGHRVAPFGYIRLHLPGYVRYEKVALLSEHRLMVLFERSRELDQGMSSPAYCSDTRSCKNCTLRTSCFRLRKNRPAVA